MTDDNKPPIFGPSFVIDPANHEPRSGKSALMNQMMAELAGKTNLAETFIGKDAHESRRGRCRGTN